MDVTTGKRINKRLLLILITIVIILLGIGIYIIIMPPPETGIDVPAVQDGQTSQGAEAYIRAEYQLFPPQEQVFDADFDKAYKEFVKAVLNKDLSVLDGFLYDKIESSPYDNDPKSIDEFYDYWNLADNTSKESGLWPVLEEIIKLGGYYDKEMKCFVAPYTYFGCPEEYQDESDYCFIIIDKNVNLYAEKNIHSKAIATLDYNIVYLDKGERGFSEKTGNDLVKINTPSGMKGYIQKKYIRSLIDFRFEIRYVDDGWKLMYLIYGEQPRISH